MKWLLFSLILAGCSGGAVCDCGPAASASTGGTPGNDANAGSGGAGPGSGGATPAEGTGGVAGTCSYHENRNACGTCAKTLAEFCGAACPTLREMKCSHGVVLDTVQRGCGVVVVTHRGDVGDLWGEGYDEATGALIYAFNNGGLSFGCRDAWTAGEVPKCDYQEIACESLGLDGG